MARALAGRTMVITGASSGIGEATARLAAAAGMNLVLAARREPLLRELAAELERPGLRVAIVPCDVADPEQVDRLFEAAWEALGRLDVLFANAGYGLMAPVEQLSEEAHHAIFETNYFGTVRCLQRAIALMRRTEDGLRHLLICSSAASEIAIPNAGAYSATKAAQDVLGGALRAELASEGFEVTTVHPIGTRTAFFEAAERVEGVSGEVGRSNTPSFLAQTPEVVARAVVKALRRPRPEVWPRPLVRYVLALTTACPRLAAWMLSRHTRRKA